MSVTLKPGESVEAKVEMTPELIKRLEAGEVFKVEITLVDPLLNSKFGGAITYGFAMYGLYNIVLLAIQAWQ
jgi:hypothetical protein